MGNGSPDVTLTALNEADQKAGVYVGVSTTLDVSLVNNGDLIVLNSSGTASSLEIFMPIFFTLVDMQNMSISLAGWAFSVNTIGPSLRLIYNRPDNTNWIKGQPIAFQITNVQSTEQVTTDSVQVNFHNMGGDVPIQVQTPFTLSEPPKPGNALLRDVLQVSLDNQGSVYVSTSTDPLQNSLFLNLKNIGVAPLRSGTLAGTPQITIAFVYGKTSGALAPDSDTQSLGSAWNIVADVSINETDGWHVANPSTTGTDPHPKWLLEPTTTNPGIIGIGDEANVTFSFSTIISLTPPGHTQMVVQFSGFMKDANTPYNDEVFILDIVKQEPPPTRGLINFFGENPLLQVMSPDQPVNIPLRWTMFDVATVHLICSFPNIKMLCRTYHNPLPLDYDCCTLVIPGIKGSGPIFVTLQAFDGNGGYLNSMQFTVFTNALMFIDQRDGKVYPVVELNHQLWMAQNLAYDGPGSFIYLNLPENEIKYGRLYTGDSPSLDPHQEGWRVPSLDDWQGLFGLFGSPAEAYAALIDGGTTGFNARLGGERQSDGNFASLTVFGFYRTSSSDGVMATFSSFSNTVNTIGDRQQTAALSVRYVKDL